MVRENSVSFSEWSCWWNRSKDPKKKRWEEAHFTKVGRGGSGGLSRTERESQRDERKGKLARRRQLAAFMAPCSKAKRQEMNFSHPEKLQESCRLGRAAEGMCCISATHVPAAWQSYCYGTWPIASILKNTLLSSSGGTDAPRGNNLMYVRKRPCPHIRGDADVAWGIPRKLLGKDIGPLLFVLHISLKDLQLWNTLLALNLFAVTVGTIAHLLWSLWDNVLVLRARQDWMHAAA